MNWQDVVRASDAARFAPERAEELISETILRESSEEINEVTEEGSGGTPPSESSYQPASSPSRSSE